MSDQLNWELDDNLDEGTQGNAIVYAWDVARDIVDEIKEDYLDYAMSVIVSRALPDIRDWLKPVHRRILYSMYEQWLRSSAKFRKSRSVVWDVLAKYHPHGDSSVYEAMVRLAQDFSLRYPLVHGQWNFGSMDGDSAAAYRYTEAKITKLAEFMLRDIEKETVDFRDNFDSTRQEPIVLPTRIPNLLMNWVMGIAVGMATNIPPHNLRELIDALDFMLQSEDIDEISIEDLMQFVKWPDFPTGWIVYDHEALLRAYSTGRWSVIVRWVAEIKENNKKRHYIHISEIPYGINKAKLVEKIAILVKEKKIIGISDLRDESDKDGVRIIIELKKDAFPKKVLNQIFKLTPLQSSFGYNVIWLTDRWTQPRLHNLKDILSQFIEHRREVIFNRVTYELKIAEARAHILEWLKIALDNIDEVIRVIRSSYDDAEIQLQKVFGLSEIQANAIVEMKLRRLQWLEKEKIEAELGEKLAFIADCKDILIKPARIIEIVRSELQEIKEKFGDDRRTVINLSKLWEFNPKDTIPDSEVIITISRDHYIKRISQDVFRTQRRWWVWVKTSTKDEDEISLVLSSTNHNDILFFTTMWRVYKLPAYEIPESSRTAKWTAIVNLISLEKWEEIASVLDITATKNKYLFFATKVWVSKRLDTELVKNIRSNGLIVIKIKEWDALTWVRSTSGNNNVILTTKLWKAIQFDENDVRDMGRRASWVRGIRLAKWDEVVWASIIEEWDEYLMIISENGMWKISKISDYRDQNRWWSGVKSMDITKKTWNVVGAIALSDDDRKNSDLLLISSLGQTIRMPLTGIRVTSRVTQWVILTKLRADDDKIVKASLIREVDGEEVEKK